MNKLPSTQGGAAGSFVRGNAFFKDRPTPYSTTQRGDDTITVDPYGITARRKPPERPVLPVELLPLLVPAPLLLAPALLLVLLSLPPPQATSALAATSAASEGDAAGAVAGAGSGVEAGTEQSKALASIAGSCERRCNQCNDPHPTDGAQPCIQRKALEP